MSNGNGLYVRDVTSLSRRAVIGAIGATGFAAGAWGSVGASDGGEVELDDGTYDPSLMELRYVDIEDGDEVSGIIESVADGEVLVFPAGQFRWSETVNKVANNWGIVGQPHDRTVFMIPEDDFRFMNTALGSSVTGRASENLLLKNLTFDSPGRANPSLRLGVESMGHVENLHYRCNGMIRTGSMENGVLAFVQDEEGDLTLRNYKQHNNGRLSDYNSGDGRVGLWTGGGHFGTAQVINPVLTGFPNNACYVGRTSGTVNIIGGYLANNNVSCVRVSGGITVRGTTMELDIDSYLDGPGETTGGVGGYNTRMIWGDRRGAGSPGGLVQGCSFVLRSYDNSQGLVHMLDNPHLTVRESQFFLGDQITAVDTSSDEITLSNNVFDGDASATAGVGTIHGRNNCVVEGIDPGDVPTIDRNCEFNWARTHGGGVA